MKTFRLAPAFAVAVAALIVSACTSNSTTPPTIPTALPQSDTAFITFAAQSSNSEIAAAQLALKNSTNSSVIAFAQRMISDHTTANQQLAALPTVQNGFGALPTTGLPSEAQTAAQLATLTSTAFDRAYVSDQVNGHAATIAQFQNEAQNGQAADVKNFAAQQLPVLQTHLQLAQTLAAQLGISTSPAPVTSGSPAATASGSPAATASGSPAATASGSPSATASGSPAASASASPRASTSPGATASAGPSAVPT